jgi:ABC-2 type transport system permease protein
MTPRSRRLLALMRKEFVQVLRDPSSLLIAFVLPMILLFLFGYGVSLDAKRLPVGVAVEGSGAAAHSLALAFAASPFFATELDRDPRPLTQEMLAGRLRGVVVIPEDFGRRLAAGGDVAPVQILTDGSETNTANYVQNYAQGVLSVWLAQRRIERGAGEAGGPRLVPRIWFNPQLASRDSLIPGGVAIIMAIIGTLLTALVVAREWERGTMEALMATPVGVAELIAGKLVPYFALGLLAMFGSVAASVWLFHVPFRGSLLALLATSTAFLLAALGQGLLISTVAKNQFVAAQVALITGFLPAFLLSGFIFEISSMPLALRALTHIIAARYLVTNLQTLFLVGDVWPLLLPNIAILLLLAAVLFAITAKKTVKRLR